MASLTGGLEWFRLNEYFPVLMRKALLRLITGIESIQSYWKIYSSVLHPSELSSFQQHLLQVSKTYVSAVYGLFCISFRCCFLTLEKCFWYSIHFISLRQRIYSQINQETNWTCSYRTMPSLGAVGVEFPVLSKPTCSPNNCLLVGCISTWRVR